MAGSMSRADLVADLKSSLRDAATTFTAAADADFVRHLDKAAADMHRVRPNSKVGQVTLASEQQAYDGPPDMLRFRYPLRQRVALKPWDPGYAPVFSACHAIGCRLVFDVPPSSAQIAAHGSNFVFVYVALDSIGATAAETTIAAPDRDVLLLRAQAEALLELSLRDSVRPVQIGGGFGQQAKTGTPAALYHDLMAEWARRAR